MKNVFMFSGQGTQYFHMGSELRKHSPLFERNFTKLSHLVKEITACSVSEVVYDPQKRKSDNFTDPRLSNIALITVQYALAQTLKEEGVVADLVCGMSLGEYTAAVVAGALTFEDAVQLVADTGACFNRFCDPGAMLAILDSSRVFYNHQALHASAEIAFDSHDKHFVIAGFKSKINDVMHYLRQENICFQALPVAFGYHSSNIDPAHSAFADIFATASFSTPRLPIVSAVEGRHIEHLNGDHFWRTARGPIRFIEAVGSIGEQDNFRFIDLGATGTMANLMRYRNTQQGQSKIFPIITPFANGHINIKKLVKEVKLELSVKAVQGPNKVSTQAHRPTQAWVFPGQGSQHPGMGVALFKHYPELVAKADQVLGYSIEALCIDDPESNLNKTQYTQPALFVVNALHYRQRTKNSQLPSYLAGHSLGEYSALYAAGAVDFETGLRLVQKRGALMAQAQDGGMAAVLGLSEHQVREVLECDDLQKLVMANINGPAQLVISGPKAGILAAQRHFEAAGCSSYVPLPISGAFHSPLMKPAAKEFANFITHTVFGCLNIPVISNVTGCPYKDADIANSLIKQITHSVRWTDTLAYLIQQGVVEIEEVGPGLVLSKLITAFRAGHTSFAKNQQQQHETNYHKESA